MTLGTHIKQNDRICDARRKGGGHQFSHRKQILVAISRWEIAYIVDQDQNVGLNRPPTSDFRRT